MEFSSTIPYFLIREIGNEAIPNPAYKDFKASRVNGYMANSASGFIVIFDLNCLRAFADTSVIRGRQWNI